jgi:hypothetical protein
VDLAMLRPARILVALTFCLAYGETLAIERAGPIRAGSGAWVQTLHAEGARAALVASDNCAPFILH